MAEIVNLRQARKRAARAQKEEQAEANRARHGLPARERKMAAAEKARSKARHEAHRRDCPAGHDED